MVLKKSELNRLVSRHKAAAKLFCRGVKDIRCLIARNPDTFVTDREICQLSDQVCRFASAVLAMLDSLKLIESRDELASVLESRDFLEVATAYQLALDNSYCPARLFEDHPGYLVRKTELERRRLHEQPGCELSACGLASWQNDVICSQLKTIVGLAEALDHSSRAIMLAMSVSLSMDQRGKVQARFDTHEPDDRQIECPQD